MRMAICVLALFLASACAGGKRAPAAAAFDLGGASLAWQPAALPVRGVEVAAPSWLATPALHYRLLYADPMRRQAYAESRWAAPPAELIERALNRQAPSSAGGCVLRLELDELAQVFDAPQSSRTLLEARARLLPPGRGATLAQKAFAVAPAAETPDARGGVAAAAAAVRALGGELNAWLAQLAREDAGVASSCK